MSDFLAGLSSGQIPVAGTRRRSIGAALGGQVYRIGRIWANRAFVVVRGNLRLLYVARDYRNYAAVARRVFDDDGGAYDYDHVLGRALCRQQGFDYILITRLQRAVNRSHGTLERPQTAGQFTRQPIIVLDKFCYVDERIYYKMIGRTFCEVPSAHQVSGYTLVKCHQREDKPAHARIIRHALGMTHGKLDLGGLTLIKR